MPGYTLIAPNPLQGLQALATLYQAAASSQPKTNDPKVQEAYAHLLATACAAIKELNNVIPTAEKLSAMMVQLGAFILAIEDSLKNNRKKFGNDKFWEPLDEIVKRLIQYKEANKPKVEHYNQKKIVPLFNYSGYEIVFKISNTSLTGNQLEIEHDSTTGQIKYRTKLSGSVQTINLSELTLTKPFNNSKRFEDYIEIVERIVSKKHLAAEPMVIAEPSDLEAFLNTILNFIEDTRSWYLVLRDNIVSVKPSDALGIGLNALCVNYYAYLYATALLSAHVPPVALAVIIFAGMVGITAAVFITWQTFKYPIKRFCAHVVGCFTGKTPDWGRPVTGEMLQLAEAKRQIFVAEASHKADEEVMKEKSREAAEWKSMLELGKEVRENQAQLLAIMKEQLATQGKNSESRIEQLELAIQKNTEALHKLLPEEKTNGEGESPRVSKPSNAFKLPPFPEEKSDNQKKPKKESGNLAQEIQQLRDENAKLHARITELTVLNTKWQVTVIDGLDKTKLPEGFAVGSPLSSFDRSGRSSGSNSSTPTTDAIKASGGSPLAAPPPAPRDRSSSLSAPIPDSSGMAAADAQTPSLGQGHNS